MMDKLSYAFDFVTSVLGFLLALPFLLLFGFAYLVLDACSDVIDIFWRSR